MKLRNISITALAGLGWLLTIGLVTQLLSGTFDTRSCTTACTQVIYWSAFATVVVGLIVGLPMLRHTRDAITVLSLLALAGLLGIFIVTMFIGTFL